MCVQCTFSNALSKIPTSYSLYTNFFSLLRDMVTEFDDGKATTAKACNLSSERNAELNNVDKNHLVLTIIAQIHCVLFNLWRMLKFYC